MQDSIEILLPAKWSYTEPNLEATCRIDKQRGRVDLTLEKTGQTFVDVLEVKRWAVGKLSTPTTLRS